uniref:Uncharacterized protein n=1 Tax=Triticum urartu TaxID=4572 RepID=A0A8R7V3Y3_TRIUA
MWLGFDQNPLYALLHESIYCEGSSSKWSADKIFNENGSLFNPVKATAEGRPVYLTEEV